MYTHVYIYISNIQGTGRTEIVTDVEKREEQNFLNAVVNTPVMQYLHKYLVAKGKMSVCIYIYIRVCVLILMNMCICMCVYLCVYIYI